MHYDCWNAYLATEYCFISLLCLLIAFHILYTLIRLSGFPNYQRHFAYDIQNGESVCPLCKSVVNSLLPLSLQNDNSIFPYDLDITSTISENFRGLLNNSCNENRFLSSQRRSELVNFFYSLLSFQSLNNISKGDMYNAINEQIRIVSGEQSDLNTFRSVHSMWASTAYTLFCSYICSINTSGQNQY
jgi:hypothetical protein